MEFIQDFETSYQLERVYKWSKEFLVTLVFIQRFLKKLEINKPCLDEFLFPPSLLISDTSVRFLVTTIRAFYTSRSIHKAHLIRALGLLLELQSVNCIITTQLKNCLCRVILPVQLSASCSFSSS